MEVSLVWDSQSPTESPPQTEFSLNKAVGSAYVLFVATGVVFWLCVSPSILVFTLLGNL